MYLGRILLGFAYIISFINWILGSIIYIWTLYIAYKSGIFEAIITFFLPVIGQIYWGYQAWNISGFESPYIQWLIVLVVLVIIQYAIILIGAKLEDLSKTKTVTTDDSPIYYGFGGWLILVAIGLITTFFQSVYYSTETLIPLYTSGDLRILVEQSPFLALIIVLETVFYIYTISMILLIAYYCFRQKKMFKKLMIIYLTLGSIIGIIYLLIAYIVPEIPQENIDDQISKLISSIIHLFIWVPYFIKSKRVNNTYVS